MSFKVRFNKPQSYYTHTVIRKSLNRLHELSDDSSDRKEIAHLNRLKERFYNRLKNEPNRKVRLAVVSVDIGRRARILHFAWHGWSQFYWNMPWIARKFGEETYSGYYAYQGWLGVHDDI